MSKYVIDSTAAEKEGMSLADVFLLLLVKTACSRGLTPSDLLQEGLQRGLIRENVLGYHAVTPEAAERLENVLMAVSSTDVDPLIALAEKLQSLFPQGKKPGTNYYWRGNKKEIAIRLGKFLKYYGEKVPEEDIINATKAYVDSFNGDYSFMRLLKYFILKQDKYSAEDGGISTVSELASFLENANQENTLSADWISVLV